MRKLTGKPSFEEFAKRANKLFVVIEENIENNNQLISLQNLMEEFNCSYHNLYNMLKFLERHKKLKRISSDEIPENGKYIQIGYRSIWAVL